MNTEKNLNKRNGLYLAMVAAATLMLSACGDDNNDDNSTADISKPVMPAGLGFEQYVAAPDAAYPLPVILYGKNNGHSTLKYSIHDNPYPHALKGINSIWKGTSDAYQSAASGSGPDSYEANPIKNAAVWAANIAYVEKVTAERSDEAAIRAYLDDRRGKSYSVVDGFGPLTEDYVANSGTYYDITEPTVAQVLEDSHYLGDSDDSWTFTGDENSAFGAAVRFTNNVRYNMAATSTSGSKYIFSTPRPWRMTSTGAVEYLGNDLRTCINSSGAPADINFDIYNSDVSVIPGLVCARRKSNSGDEQSLRKDGGYPSGHTNAGVVSSLSLAYAFPVRFAEHVVRGSELGENRIVAGMHSPVDVIGGRIMALMSAADALNTTAGYESGQAAYNQLHAFYETKAAEAGMNLYDYAHRTLAEGETGSVIEADGVTVNADVFNNNDYDDHAAIKALYRFRMTYGLPQDSSKAGQPAVVPEGAEALLKTRQPYLSDAQRRAVLFTTEVDSGYPILDDSNGWGRINLVDAADGYGAFLGDVSVTMEASDGGFSARDWWRNDISGAGKLSKAGSGHLTLTGNNSYSGGTVINGGTLEAASASAFGQGDLFVNSGTALVDARGALQLGGNITLNGAAVLKLAMDADSTQVATAETLFIDGAMLTLDFAGLTPQSGAAYTLLQAGKVAGEFSHVDAGDYGVTLEYTGTSVIARLN
ncbi:autotransporter-associated beta strand repeat-containing protein [Thalassolituus alkanivorans]|uniref:autotransporter-associated beta strand repeat-containing protein n=1 Tax=Thalassolituus alkanivorans TaxID=2881055 RepID=UPI002E239683